VSKGVVKYILIISVLLNALFLSAVGYGVYQIQKPVIQGEKAISKTQEYVYIINERNELNYNIENISTVHLKEDSITTLRGEKVWIVWIDGISVTINAYSGDLIEMVFPLDGVITKKSFPYLQ
jgi:hypothetical protein